MGGNHCTQHYRWLVNSHKCEIFVHINVIILFSKAQTFTLTLCYFSCMCIHSNETINVQTYIDDVQGNSYIYFVLQI